MTVAQPELPINANHVLMPEVYSLELLGHALSDGLLVLKDLDGARAWKTMLLSRKGLESFHACYEQMT